MNETEATALRADNLRLTRENADLHTRLNALEQKQPATPVPSPASLAKIEDKGQRAEAGPAAPVRKFTLEESRDNETLYQAIKARLFEEASTDPILLKVLATRNEIEVTVQRRTVKADCDSAVGRVAQLIGEGFFDSPKTPYASWNESKRRGFAGAAARMDEACKKLLEQGFLTKESEGFQAVSGMKVNIIEDRS